MKRILIVSTSFDLQKGIESAASKQGHNDFWFETTGSFGQDPTFWVQQAPHALILDLPSDEVLQNFFLTKLRKDVPTHQPIVLVCSSMSPAVMQMSTHFSRLRTHKAPVDASSLYRTLFDLTRDYGKGQTQIHPRYLTDQPVEVRSDYTSGSIQGIMKNLSLSGAYFEANSPAFPIKSGDLLKISIFSGPPDQMKQYVFDVKVVWSKVQPSGAQGYGVAFINKEEVYNQLLKNL